MIETTVGNATVLDARRPVMSSIAVISGWLVAMGIGWVFFVGGLAVGFTSFDLSDTDSVAKGIGIGTTVWLILTWAVSLFLGGMFASWVDGRPDQAVGTLHGIAVWGLAMTVTILLGAVGASTLMQGGASLIKGAATVGAAGAGAAGTAQGGGGDSAMSRASGLLGAQLKRAVSQRNAGQPGSPAAAAGTPATGANPATPGDTRGAPAMDVAATNAIALDLLRGKPDDAKSRLAAETGMPAAEVDQVMQSMSAQAERAKAQLKEAADQARRYTAAVMWGLLLSSLIALVAAAIGGWAGAGYVHRVHDGRRY